MKQATIEYFFPIKFLYGYSEKNKELTYSLFFISLTFSACKGFFFKKISDPYALIGYFDHWGGITKKLFDIIIIFFYSPFGIVFWLLLINVVFLFLIYLFSGLKKKGIKFSCFIIPFFSLCYLAIAIWIVSFILSIFSLQLPYLIRILIYFYWVTSYCLILFWKYNVTTRRCIISVALSFSSVFLLGGFPTIAPYLQWI